MCCFTCIVLSWRVCKRLSIATNKEGVLLLEGRQWNEIGHSKCYMTDKVRLTQEQVPGNTKEFTRVNGRVDVDIRIQGPKLSTKQINMTDVPLLLYSTTTTPLHIH